MNRCPSAVRAMLTVAAVGLVVVGCTARPGAPGATPIGATCPMFPADSFWHGKVDRLTVHPSSASWVSSIGAGSHVHADFGSGEWNGGPIGIPAVAVQSGQAKVPISFEYADESDPGPYPVPSDAPIEGGAQSSGDRHVLVVDDQPCRLYEIYGARPGPSSWTAGSGAVWDLRSNDLRPVGWTSADAAGLAILPGLVRYDEVSSGRIDHMIRFTVPRTQRAFVWPARHQAGSSSSAALPPMGAVFRLKSTVDPDRFSGAARVIAVALRDHGLIVADNGSSWYLSGSPDPRWDNDQLHQLDVLAGSDFEAVSTAPCIVQPNSGAWGC